jgi:hypothetical protein
LPDLANRRVGGLSFGYAKRGEDGIRTRVEGFADLCLSSRPLRRSCVLRTTRQDGAGQMALACRRRSTCRRWTRKTCLRGRVINAVAPLITVPPSHRPSARSSRVASVPRVGTDGRVLIPWADLFQASRYCHFRLVVHIIGLCSPADSKAVRRASAEPDISVRPASFTADDILAIAEYCESFDSHRTRTERKSTGPRRDCGRR